jgi:hypothetical protein
VSRSVSPFFEAHSLSKLYRAAGFVSVPEQSKFLRYSVVQLEQE